SPRGVAKLDTEQTAPAVILVAWSTYSPRKPAYSTVSEFAPGRKLGRQDTASSPQDKTATLMGQEGQGLRKSIDCCKIFERSSQFSAKFEEKRPDSRRI